MNENENNFDPLRRLLAFKKGETPPPGYFHNFSSQVVARIRAGEADAPSTTSEKLMVEAPWLVKLLQAFEFKPAYAGTFALALCLVLVFGIVYAERPESAPQSLLAQPGQVSAPLALASPTDFIPPAESSSLIASNNSAVNLGSVASLFSEPNQNELAQQASFAIPSR